MDAVLENVAMKEPRCSRAARRGSFARFLMYINALRCRQADFASSAGKLPLMQTRALSRRRMTSWLTVVSLLFSQLALASYVCPTLSAEERMSERMAAGLPCDGNDSSTPVLCHQHATNASLSFEIAKVAAPSLPAIVQMLVVPLLHDAARVAVVSFGDRPEARPPPDPVFLQTLRLRV